MRSVIPGQIGGLVRFEASLVAGAGKWLMCAAVIAPTQLSAVNGRIIIFPSRWRTASELVSMMLDASPVILGSPSRYSAMIRAGMSSIGRQACRALDQIHSRR